MKRFIEFLHKKFILARSEKQETFSEMLVKEIKYVTSGQKNLDMKENAKIAENIINTATIENVEIRINLGNDSIRVCPKGVVEFLKEDKWDSSAYFYREAKENHPISRILDAIRKNEIRGMTIKVEKNKSKD